MSKINEGGPAFPVAAVNDVHAGHPGMLLRDYFATTAPTLSGDCMAQLLGWPDNLPLGEDGDEEYVDSVYRRWKDLTVRERAEAESKWAYICADAMLAERAKEQS